MSRYKVPELSSYEWQKSVQNIRSSPPVTPLKGDRHIIGSNASGIWSGKENQIAEYDDAWEYTIPFEGMTVYVNDYHRTLQFNIFWDETTAIGRCVVRSENTGRTLTLNDIGKILTCESSSTQIFNLPSVSVDDIGIVFRFSKLGIGIVRINASDSDIITDSSAGGYIQNSKSFQTWALISLVLVKENIWSILDGIGTWETA